MLDQIQKMATDNIENCDDIITIPILDPNEENSHRPRSLLDIDPNSQVGRVNHNGTENNGVNRPAPRFDPLRYLVPATDFVLVWFAVIVILGVIAQLAVAVLGIYLKYNPTNILKKS